jgi:hypothetical protein
MLSTVLQKLETLFSKHMLLSAFYPILVTVFLNLLLLQETSPRFRAWLASRQPAANLETLIGGMVIAFAIGISAFFLSTISLYLRRVIEGYHWPDWLCKVAVPIQNGRLAEIENNKKTAGQLRRELLRIAPTIESQMNRAREAGHQIDPPWCNYPASLPQIDALRLNREKGQLIRAQELTAAVSALVTVLERNNADVPVDHPKTEDAERLDQDHDALEKLFPYALDRAAENLITFFVQRESEFGEGIVEPTAAGNMVRAVSSYAQRRYGFSMDLLWTRLQQAMQGHTFYDTVLDAKAELDSLIALFWLTAVTWIGWWLWLAFTVESPWTFLVIALAGPASSWLLHRLILASYQSFNDLLRASVDLYRFQVLEALHIALPDGPTSEKQIWEAVATHNAYGEKLTLTYTHGTRA